MNHSSEKALYAGGRLLQIVLSLDYEVFGNGAGDVMRDVVEPTDRLLDICDRYGAKMTIMFEVAEYWAFEQYDERLRQDLGYSPYEAMKKQAIDAIDRGHDVQLHLHPQWIGAEYDNRIWRLNNAYWRLADLPGGLGTQDQPASIAGALHRGKRTLEEMLVPVKRDYECICFRAGGFYAQPSHEIIRAMKTVGLRADSSVVKGYRKTAPFQVDYSHVDTDDAVWWTSETELTKTGMAGENVLELSVSSSMEPYWKSFKMTKLVAALQRQKREKATRGNRPVGDHMSSVPTAGAVLKNLLRSRASTFDFCKLSTRDMLRRLGRHNRPEHQPVVMIGHSKDFINDRHFEAFLDALNGDENVRFVNLSESVQQRLIPADDRRTSEAVDVGSRPS